MRFVLLLLVPTLAAPGALAGDKAVARRIFREILSGGNFTLAGELYAPDFVNHGRNRDVDLATDQSAAREWKKAFPDLVVEPEVLVAEGDVVAAVWHASGTNTGSGNGIPATGRRIEGRGITFWRVAGGRVREEWSEFSQLALLQQLGLVPGAGPIEPGSARLLREERAAGTASEADRARNRALVARVLEETLGSGRIALFGALYAKDFVNHGPTGDGGVQEQIDQAVELRKLLPDLTVSVTRSIAEGNLVAVIYTARGTSTGTGHPAAGKRIQLRGMAVMSIEGGRIREQWAVFDHQEQLGALTAPEGKR